MAQLRDLIVNGPSRFLGVSTHNEDVILNKGAISYANLVPGDTLSYNLGTSNARWLNLYIATVNASNTITVSGNKPSTSTASGDIQVSGGIGVGGTSFFGNNVYLGSTSYYVNGSTSKLNALETAGVITSAGNVNPKASGTLTLGTSSLRWNNIYGVSMNASGTITAGKFSGPLEGNVTGNLTGNVTGNLNGNASTASRLTTNSGSGDRPVYFTSGIPYQCDYRMAATNVSATQGIAIDNTPMTGIWYVNGTNDILSQSDGVAIVNKYNDTWITQIYQDYRTGQLAVRGKNNGTWTKWRIQLDSGNYTNYLDGYYNTKYVIKSGDTMSGNLNLQDNTNKLTLSTGGSISTEVTTTGGWARSFTWKQRNAASDTSVVKAQMGGFGDAATFKYWYVGTGYSDADTWLQVNSSTTTVKGDLVASKSTRHLKGHIYLEGSSASDSKANTTQLVFGTSSSPHIALSANTKALVLNPTTTATDNQIVLYLDQQSKFPNGINAGASTFTSSVTVGTTLKVTGATTLSNTLTVGAAIYGQNILTVDKLITGKKGLLVSGRVYDGGDDEGIVVAPAGNGFAGITLGSASGIRTVLYLMPESNTHRAVWRYNNGTTSWDVTHPETSGELIVHTADTAVGGTGIPVYIKDSGVAAPITCLSPSVGGTGNTALTSNRLVWTETSGSTVRMTSGGNHYASSTKVSIGSTAAPAGTFHVQGDTSINGAITVDSKVKFVYNSTNESLDFVFI